MIVDLVVQVIIPFLCLIEAPASVADAPSLAMPGCQQFCGNIAISYPFGIGRKDCYHNPWYEITCRNDSFNSSTPKPILTKFDMEVLNISLPNYRSPYPPYVTLNSPVASNCNGDRLWTSQNLRRSPFNFSEYNEFTVLGCENGLLINQQNEKILAGCTSLCKNISMEGCYGIDCCQTSIPYGLDIYSVNTTGHATVPNCTYAFLLDTYYNLGGNFSTRSLTSLVKETQHAPVMLRWMMTNPPDPFSRSRERYCYNSSLTTNDGEPTYGCYCREAYEGNPYIPSGCHVVEACAQCKGSCFLDRDDKFVCKRRRPPLKGIILGKIPCILGKIPCILCLFAQIKHI